MRFSPIYNHIIIIYLITFEQGFARACLAHSVTRWTTPALTSTSEPLGAQRLVSKNRSVAQENLAEHDDTQKWPKFGVAWRAEGGRGFNLATYVPVWGSWVPDCGPLNMKVVARMQFADTLWFVGSLKVPEKKKQAQAATRTKVKLLLKPRVFNSFGTIRGASSCLVWRV